ncbi:MAG: type II secretion system F family protein [Candidatus Aenigmarchaeota archaeon]|nr:type II secretion system F family protein [Candidatus Aenigmarchaeota archaeon]
MPDPYRNPYRPLRNPRSRPYKVFEEEEFEARRPKTFYEKACNRAEQIIKVNVSGKTKQKLEDAIIFSHLHITPEGAMSLTILFALFSCMAIMFLLILGLIGLPGLSFGYSVLLLMIALFFTIYIYNYPSHYKARYEIAAGSGIVTFILYMAMYMRNVPNLEGAVKFSSSNIEGAMGYEIRKLLWDVEVGNFTSMQQALLAYTNKWSKNRDFVESIELLVTSLRQSGNRRLQLLDEAVSRILEGNREQARHFNQKLKMPVMVVHAMGIILPIMGLVLFPVISVFLKVESSVLFVGYDIILPMILFFVISRILEIRPVTSSPIDISENPDIPPDGMVRIGKKNVKAWPIALLIGAVIVAFGAMLFRIDKEGLFPAVIITTGISIGIGTYFTLLAKQRIKVRNETRAIESEFSEALFQLGNQVSSGKPIEVSIEQSMDRIENLKIKDLFERALDNMKVLGMTFQQAFFDRQFGAIKRYPSKMIKSIMNTVIESSKKGVDTAANAMITVSRYLKNIHDTQEEVTGELNETISSLKFQVYFLSPMVSGIVVTMAIIIIRILAELAAKVGDLPQSTSLPFISSFAPKITPLEFILIVGIYIIETAFILSTFINAIETGEDKISYYNILGTTLIVGQIVFVIILFITLAIFTPLITSVVG